MEEDYKPEWKEMYNVSEQQYKNATLQEKENFHQMINSGFYALVNAVKGSSPESVREELFKNLGNILFPSEESKVNLDKLFGQRA